ncbi:putative quinol monooxygenase [Spirosoma foliorum]|uniref:Antibiotic biosynthesis monooxygenase n=1 Tax=Spirosoma foliorum TaxID=2710596 RepID=A0A7G5GZU9_9BACT|nr:putative quinol monooxygenase [Spirosoma foliorum]QMW04391.1 antibiotic biosynthesis monooxygenase [Spirosoma foliorum]
MDNKAVYIVAKWQVKEGQLEAVKALLPELVKQTTTEKGNLFYKIHQRVADQHTLILFEGYADEAAMNEHRNSAHFQELVVQQIVPLLEKREVDIASELVFD